MTPDKWKLIKPILEAAMDLPGDARLDYLKSTGLDRELLEEAAAILAFDQEERDILDDGAASIFASTENDDMTAPLIGTEVDRYRIISLLGVGGMGAVYLAKRSDGEFEQNVALKVIKSGISSSSILRRFYGERQILASLDHKNIAHLIDGGTTRDGLPYLVMEYVDGVSIIDYARKHALSLDQRLDLFREVCSAVSFAHQNLVIHRDIKPSNIIVNADGSPKLLDFGIAKLLRADGVNETSTQHIVFTPEYASPEQISGDNLTTATDLYSLGVILYELLTGVRPISFEGKNFGQILQTATKSTPLRPSSSARTRENTSTDDHGPGNPNISDPQFAKDLKGDLDNIILKTLQREPERRYSSVEQLSEDIRRYLKGLPILARSDNWPYRARKFAGRNPLVVGSVALTFIILAVGIFATAYQARRANFEREKAEQRFNDVRTLANSFIFEVNEKIDESPIKARELLVSRSIEYLDKLASESAGNTGLQGELASAYVKIGDVQAELFKPNLGNAGGALESQKKALQLRQTLCDKSPADIQRSLDLVQSYHKVGNLYSVTGDIREALDNYQKAAALSESVSALAPDRVDVSIQLSNSFIMLGQAILRSGSLSECLNNYEKAFELDSRLIAADPTNVELRRKQSVVYSYIGYAKLQLGRVDEAVADFANALSIDREIFQTDPQNLRNQNYLASSFQFLGIGYREKAEYAKSLAYLTKAFQIQQSIYDLDKQNFGEQNSLADCYLELALTWSKLDKAAPALDAFQNAITNYQSVSANDPADFAARRQIFLAKRLRADLLLRIGKTAQAMNEFEECRVSIVELISKDPNNLEWKFDLAVCLSRLGSLKSLIKNRESSFAYYNDALSLLESLITRSPENVIYRRELDELRARIGREKTIS